jgi:hypothetical protein
MSFEILKLKQVQGRVNKVLQLIISYSKAVGVAEALARMINTPIEVEEDNSDAPFSTERPRFNKQNLALGSSVLDTCYAKARSRRGVRFASDDIELERLQLELMPPNQVSHGAV